MHLSPQQFLACHFTYSCCFWLYDNAAAADEFSVVNAATVESENAAGEQRAGVETQMPLNPLAAGSSNHKVPIVLNDYKKSKEVASEEEAPVTTKAATTRQEADSVGLKLGTAPRTSAKTTTTTTKPGDVKDTSVKLNVLSSSNVNINNNNNEHISVVPNSELNNNAENVEATAEVPKNHLNNKINHNIYTNTNANQLEQSQQAELIDDVMIPKNVPQQQQSIEKI